MHDIFELISKSISLVGCHCRLLECVSIGVYLTETSVCLTGTSDCLTGTRASLIETRVCLTGSTTAVLRYNIFCLIRTNFSQSIALNCNVQVRITVTGLKTKNTKDKKKRDRISFLTGVYACIIEKRLPAFTTTNLSVTGMTAFLTETQMISVLLGCIL